MKITYSNANNKTSLKNHIDESLKFINSAISCINDIDNSISCNKYNITESLKKSYDSLKNFEVEFENASIKYEQLKLESKVTLDKIEMPVIKDNQHNIKKV